MKLSLLLFFATLALSCSEGAQENSNNSSQADSPQNSSTNEPTQEGLIQQGDYSSLFNRNDCQIMSAEEISSTLNMPFTDMGIKNVCSFETEWSNDKTWYLSFILNNMSKSDVQREIQSFQSDDTGMLELHMSETGDTYFGIQHMNGYLSICNSDYSAGILIRYGSVGESRAFTKVERLEHKNLALKLANAMLKKHQR